MKGPDPFSIRRKREFHNSVIKSLFIIFSLSSSRLRVSALSASDIGLCDVYIVCTVGVGTGSARDLSTGDFGTGESLGDDCTTQHCNLLSVNSAENCGTVVKGSKKGLDVSAGNVFIIGVASVKSIRRSPGSRAKVLPASVELLPPGESCVCPSDVCGVHIFCDPGDAEDTDVDAAAAASAGGRSSSSKLYCLVNFLTRETLISCFSVEPDDGVVSGRTGAGLLTLGSCRLEVLLGFTKEVSSFTA